MTSGFFQFCPCSIPIEVTVLAFFKGSCIPTGSKPLCDFPLSNLSVWSRQHRRRMLSYFSAAFFKKQQEAKVNILEEEVMSIFNFFCYPIANLSAWLQELHTFCILNSYTFWISVAALLQDIL